MQLSHPVRRVSGRLVVAAVSAALALAASLTACTPRGDSAAPSGAGPGSDPVPTQTGPSEAALAPLDPEVSLTTGGAALHGSVNNTAPRPRYALAARVDPETGHVEGTVQAMLPAGDERRLRFRFFPGLPSLDAVPEIGDVTVDGTPAEWQRDASILSLTVPPAHEPSVEARIPFSYTLAERPEPGPLDALLGGGDMTPADIGLLARHEHSVTLGHWFPVWIPPGNSAEPVPGGFGDIGNFPAADISLSLEVPDGWAVVDGGVRVDEQADGEVVVVRSEGAGIRDLSVALVRGYEQRTRRLDGALRDVTISAHAPAEHADALDPVLDETETALRTLSEAFGPYPWREFDVVSAPLAGSVGGMEWPGGTWIEAGMFSGGIPGLGALGEALDGVGVEEGLQGLLDELPGEAGLQLRTARPWTIAHEVAHTWWTIVVGNDSIDDPVADEPLAQYSACLVLRASLPEGDDVCRAQISSGYQQMRQLGEPDGVADRPTDRFRSAMQYAGLVYGKGGAFWLELERRVGRDAVVGMLRDLVEAKPFGSVDGGTIHAALVRDVGVGAGVLWSRWMTARHGDADLPVRSGEARLESMLEPLRDALADQQ